MIEEGGFAGILGAIESGGLGGRGVCVGIN